MTDRNFTTYYDQDQADRLAEWQLANPRPPGDLDRIRDAIGQVPEGFDPRDPNRPRNPDWVTDLPRDFTLAQQDTGGGSFVDIARAAVPWIPEGLLQVWIDAYIENGEDPVLAKAAMRRDPTYKEYFPGNLRPDGTVRNEEDVYTSIFEGYASVISVDGGVNPNLFGEQLIAMYEGDTSVEEFRARVRDIKSRVLDNIGQVRETFGEFYGIDGLDDAHFIAAALDPTVGDDILTRQIDISTVAATGRQSGFYIGKGTATRLVDRGYDQQTAQTNLYDPARSLVPSLNRSAQRFGVDKDFDFDEFAEAAAFKDPYQTRRIKRLQSQEAALFTGSSVRRDQSGLTGLRER